MKDFMKYTLATVVGLMLTSILMTIISIVSIAGMIASEGMSTPVEKHSILRIKLQGTIDERQGAPNPLTMLSGGEMQQLALDEALEALKKAAEHKNVEGIYLEGGGLAATPAQLQELRQALLKFKESGKWVVAYADQYTRGAYYLCSVADSIYLNPHGMMDWSGMSSQPIFYKGLMEKVGVRMQVFKVGTYKSAVEPFICDEMSPANREQVTSFLGNIWSNFQKDVAASRKLKVEALDALADSLTIMAAPETSVEGGLVDRLCYEDEVKAALRARVDIEEKEKLHFVSLSDVAKTDELGKKESNEVAVYYAYGEISDDRAAGLSQEHTITAKEMKKDLQALREDDDVKAVVVRVNSPGGSAYASEQIWREMELLRAKKPVVVSMGGMAASGGYYISCGASEIYAEPTTLTGSIGIFGMVPDASELLTKKLGVRFDVVKTNALSDFGSSMGRPFNAEESRMMQAYVCQGYELFTSRVADGRKMSQDSVKAIAEGRVWTGEQAKQLGLVDKMGNLDDAIAAAAKLADVEKYVVGRYPDAKPWYMTMIEQGGNDYMDSQLRTVLGEYYTSFSLLRHIGKQDPIQARIPFDPNIR